MLIRYADDIVAGFQHKDDAERFQAALRDRLAQFALTLHTEKTRLIEFGNQGMGSVAQSRRSSGRPSLCTAELRTLPHGLVTPAGTGAICAQFPGDCGHAQHDRDVLHAFLSTPHPKMPNFIVPPNDAADVIAYILSLRK